MEEEPTGGRADVDRLIQHHKINPKGLELAAEAGSVRRNRVVVMLVVMLVDSDFDVLRRMADEQDLPVGRVAHEILSRALRRRP
ncbi:MAG TPA: hypothetical protein VKM54_08815 [Myxococcota bacterium]|nr:hypothetical protein [Myxococcota bacterium]